MAGIRIEGNTSGNVVEVSATNELKVELSKDEATAGYAIMLSEVSEPDDQAGSVRRQPEANADFVLRTGVDQVLLQATFGGSATSANAIAQDVWQQTATTMTATAGGTIGSANSGFLIMNAGNSTTVTQGIAYRTYAQYQIYNSFPTYVTFVASAINSGATGKVLEMGVGLVTSATSLGILDGVCFRWNQSGEFRGVLCIAGVEYQTAALTIPYDEVVREFILVLSQDEVEFWVNGSLFAVLSPPTDSPAICLQPNLPVFMRVFNNAAPSPLVPAQLRISQVAVAQGAMQTNKPYSYMMSGMSQHASNVPYGTAIGMTPAITNNTTPTTGAGSNTAALVTGLGGFFQMNAIASSASDLIATSYQVPATTTAVTGSKRLYITGVRISCINFGATIATTPTTLMWSLCWGHTSVSLATTDSVSAKAPRRTTLGTMTCPVGALVGAMYTADIDLNFMTPIVVNPGEFIATAVRQIVGTATGSQTIYGMVGFGGFWE